MRNMWYTDRIKYVKETLSLTVYMIRALISYGLVAFIVLATIGFVIIFPGLVGYIVGYIIQILPVIGPAASGVLGNLPGVGVIVTYAYVIVAKIIKLARG